MTPIREVYDETAKEHGLHKYIVEDIVKSQFELVEEQMTNNTYKAVRPPFLGVFRCKPKRLEQLKITKDEK